MADVSANTSGAVTAPSGTVVTHFGPNGTTDAGNALTLLTNGKYLVVGSSTDASAGSPFAAIRYNADGTIDNTFGLNGKLSIAFVSGAGANYAQAAAVAVLANGSMVLAGSSTVVGEIPQLALARTGSTGDLDTSFDVDGRAVQKVSAAITLADQAAALAVLADGQMLVGGTFGLDMGVARFNTDGSLDTQFGSSGRAITDMGGTNDSVYAMVVQEDGRIVVAGGTVAGAPFERSANFALVRYTAAGLLDTSFSGDGRLTTDFGAAENATCIVVQPDGKLVVAGSSGDGIAVARYNVDGSLDTSFDADGLRTISVGLRASAKSLVLQADGKLVLVGQTFAANDYDFALVRLNADGSLDTGFGVTGIVTTNLGSDDFANGAVVQSDGKIVVAGASGSDFAIARYNPNGSLDTSFGTADNTPPLAISFSPANTANQVKVGANLVVGFNELVQRGSGSIVLKTASGAVIETFDAMSSGISVSGIGLTVDPAQILAYNTSYQVEFGAGAVKDLVGNSFVSATAYTFTTETNPGKTVEILAYSWKSHALLSDVALSSSPLAGISNASGAIRFEAVTGSSLELTVSRSVPSAEVTLTQSAVNLQDAIAILKMIVGLEVNGADKALSPYQAMAADFDGNGVVNLNDAIGVLKHVVGLESPQPKWHFVRDTDTSIPTKIGLTPGVAPANLIVDLSATGSITKVGLVGYLSGDVDGSYAGTAGSQDLDITQPTYFTDLVGAHSLLSLSQFGVYA
jgi:uncharacterized delta-60 repeat protein